MKNSSKSPFDFGASAKENGGREVNSGSTLGRTWLY